MILNKAPVLLLEDDIVTHNIKDKRVNLIVKCPVASTSNKMRYARSLSTRIGRQNKQPKAGFAQLNRSGFSGTAGRIFL
ncbi:MAG: hypothetical protein ABW007_03360 [Chitinophagaceae bacterium]